MLDVKKVWWVLLAVLVGCSQMGQGGRWLPDDGEAVVVNEEKAADKERLAGLPEDFARLAIPYLRGMELEGSEIWIERSVGETAGYTMMVASYESEGLKINGLLTRPKGEAPDGGWPAVVFVHGYIPPKNYVTTEKYEDYVDGLAEAGLVVFKIDLRGHGSSDGEANGAYYSSDYVIDTLNARASLAKLGYVNPEKIGLWGHSMAGNVVLRAMAVRPEIPAGVIWAGAVYTYRDMAEIGISDASYVPSQNASRGKRGELYELVGAPSEGGEFWELVAPASFVGELKGKVQVHHATNDPVVSVEYARNLERIMQAARADYELYEYPSGGHNLTGAVFGEAMWRTVEAFLGM